MERRVALLLWISAMLPSVVIADELPHSEPLARMQAECENADAPFMKIGSKRRLSDEEMGVMMLMLADSIDIYDSYLNNIILNKLDGAMIKDYEAAIKDWKKCNKGILDDGLINDSRYVSRICRRWDHLCDISRGSSTSKMRDALLERVRWRRENYNRKSSNRGHDNAWGESWIEWLCQEFGESVDPPIPVNGICLGFEQMMFVEMLNFFNGSRFLDCEDWTLQREQLGKIKDWWWANKGVMPDSDFEDFKNKLYLDYYLNFNGSDNREFRNFIDEALKGEDFDKYRGYDIIRME